MSNIKYRYFCYTENKNIFETRLGSEDKPNLCINGVDHMIDYESVSIVSSPEIYSPGSTSINEQVTSNSDDIQNIKNTLSSTNNLKNNFLATKNPLPTDDESKGYLLGSRWLNKLSNEIFTCVNSSINSAIWFKNNSNYVIEIETLNSNSTIVKTFEFSEKGTYLLNIFGIATSNSVTYYIELKGLYSLNDKLNKIDVDFLSIENQNNLNIQVNLKNDDSKIYLELIGENNKSIKWKIEYSINFLLS